MRSNPIEQSQPQAKPVEVWQKPWSSPGMATALSMLERIEAKLDRLIQALATEDDEQPKFTLDGEPIPADRPDGQEL